MRIRMVAITGGKRLRGGEFTGSTPNLPTVGERFALNYEQRYISTSPVTEVREGEFTTRSGSVYGFTILSELN